MDQETIDLYRQQKQEAKIRKEKTRIANTEALMAIHDLTINQLSPFQFRVEGVVDYFPTSGKFHNIRTNKRGHAYGNLQDFFNEQISQTVEMGTKQEAPRPSSVPRVGKQDLKPGKSFMLFGVVVTIVGSAKDPSRVRVTDVSKYVSACKISHLRPLPKPETAKAW